MMRNVTVNTHNHMRTESLGFSSLEVFEAISPTASHFSSALDLQFNSWGSLIPFLLFCHFLGTAYVWLSRFIPFKLPG